MWIHRILVLGALAVSAAAVGCGANEVDMGAGGSNPTPTPTGTATPTPTPSATPNPAMFDPVQAFMEDPAKANCASSGTCHAAPTGQAGLVFYTTPQGGVAVADKAKNRDLLSCSPNIDDYTPTGLVIQTFCNANGTVITAGRHQTTMLVTADCTALFDWLATGVGTPAACP